MLITEQNPMNIAEKIAGMLLEIQAVKLQPETPFTWASGWKSPIYCDNRISLSYPQVRNFLKIQFARILREQFPQTQVIAGVATAGIPHAALLANETGLPLIYVRAKPKSHGMTNQIEGRLEAGQNVLVIEDLISTGSSSLKAIEALRATGAEVLGMMAIFTYGFEIATQNLQNAHVQTITLSNYNVLIRKAIADGIINESQLETLQAWRTNPSTWKN